MESFRLSFILSKRPGRKKAAFQVLDLQLRSELRRQAKVVQNAMQRHRMLRDLIRGIDAAANELHAAPEVFALSSEICALAA